MIPHLHPKGKSRRRDRSISTKSLDLLPPVHEYGTFIIPEQRSWIHSLLSQQRDTLMWCLWWYTSNLTITFYNKHILSSLNASAITNTMVHLCFTFIGCYIAERGLFPHLNRAEFIRIALYSFVFALNVVWCQYAIKLIPLSLHQVSRAMTPLFQTLFTWLLAGQQPVIYTLMPLLPVCCGVAVTAFAELDLSLFALMVAISSVALTSFKGVISMIILQRDLKEKLQEYSFLILVTPFAAMELFWMQNAIVFVSWLTAEEEEEGGKGESKGTATIDMEMVILMAIGGFFAIMVNIASVGVMRRVQATSMGVMGNAKRALTIAGSMVLVESNWSWTKVMGIIVTLGGATWYAYRKEMLRLHHQKLR